MKMCWWLAASTLPALPSPRLEQACSGQRGCASSPQYHLPTGCIMNSLSLLLPGPPSGSFSDWKGLGIIANFQTGTLPTALLAARHLNAPGLPGQGAIRTNRHSLCALRDATRGRNAGRACSRRDSPGALDQKQDASKLQLGGVFKKVPEGF